MTGHRPPFDEMRNQRARTLAQQVIERQSITPAGTVSYRSRGRLIVIGGEEAQWLAAQVQSPLHAQVLLTHGADEPGVPTIPQGGRKIRIEGYLGAFTIRLGDPDSPGHQRVDADLIIDLSAKPLIESEVPPPGYWRSGTEPGEFDQVLEQVDGMVGTFEKPRFFRYDASICAHSRSGQPGCTRCLDACPADAIISIGEQVEVNPNLCQGGGICATVCPTGAMRYAYPDVRDTANTVRSMLMTYIEAGGKDPVILFASAEDASELPETPPHVLLVAVEELASVGHEIWLSALAWGARCVLLVDRGSVPRKAATALAAQVQTCHALLDGMGLKRESLKLIADRDLPAACEPNRDLPAPTAYSANVDKRQLVGMAVDHLASLSTDRADIVSLPESAPYGAVHVDRDSCTLCMGCTSVCPAKALSAGEQTPRLDFFESNCVQCGICANACPEQAISLIPRYQLNAEARRRPVVLNEEPPFCCVECGKPFATLRVIDNVLAKLAGHAMFATERARRRLQMCEDCRVVDAVQDPDAMQGGPTPSPDAPVDQEH